MELDALKSEYHNNHYGTFYNCVLYFRCPFPDCSGHGHCSKLNGTCLCNEVYTLYNYNKVACFKHTFTYIHYLGLDRVKL